MGFKLPVMHKGTQPFLLGALAGAVLVGWVGFDALGWKTRGAAETLARQQADVAVGAAYGRICSAQFKAAPNLPERLAELQKVQRYARGEVVAKAGFATMFGEKEPARGAAEACADLLIPDKS